MRTAYRTIFFFAALTVMIGGCAAVFNNSKSVTGSGTMIEETRELADFSRIELRTMGQVTVTLGEPVGVQLRVEDNLMPLVLTNVRDGWLVIESPPDTTLSPTRTIEIDVSVPEVVEIKLSGAGLIRADGVAAEALTTSISGSGNVILSGTANRQTVELSGAGNYDASALASRDAVVNLSGTGNVVVDVSETLNTTLTGTGSIQYSGDPTVTQSGSGTGTVRPR